MALIVPVTRCNSCMASSHPGHNPNRSFCAIGHVMRCIEDKRLCHVVLRIKALRCDGTHSDTLCFRSAQCTFCVWFGLKVDKVDGWLIAHG